jgi:hypothetical protein
MINAEDDVLYDLSPSCTVEVAVAKMLGWMQGHIRQRIIKVTEQGISADQLPHIPSLEGSLQDQLMEMRGAAKQAFIEAAEKYASDDTSYNDLRDKEEAVIECDALFNKAATCLRDIQDEISKGESSVLKIDQQATDQTGEIHLTLNSVDRWAKEKYGISIFEGSKVQESTQNIAVKNDDQIEATSDRKGGLRKVKADNLYTTFAFLLESFASKTSKYMQDGKINVDALAKFLHEQAVAADTNLSGQSHEAIKDRIEEALKIKKSKLSGA